VIAGGLLVSAYVSPKTTAAPLVPAPVWCPVEPTSAEEKLHTDMRKLWEDHVTWTRNVIFNIIDDMPGGDESTKRLLKNQDDMGNASKPRYGEAAGARLTELLRTHIVQAA